jgi:DNA polymerase III delta subunit
MLYFFIGTDREKARTQMNAAIARAAGKSTVVRISDAHTVADLEMALRGAGMFDTTRVVVFDSVCANEEMRAILLDALPRISKSPDAFFLLEEKPDAQTKRTIEKYAEKTEKFDAVAQKKENFIFALANALRRGDKKTLWLGYQRELAAETAPEAIHGVLFWGAKDMLLKSRPASAERRRAEQLIAELAELPHEARRKGVELEYALEALILSQ